MTNTAFRKFCTLYFLRGWQAISKTKLINWSAGVIKSKGTAALLVLKKQLLSPYFLFGATFVAGFFAILYLKILSTLRAFCTSGAVYLVSNSQSAWLLLGFIALVLALVFFLILQQQAALGKHILTASAWICGIAPLVIFCADLLWMLMGLKGQAATVTFSDMFFSNYCRQEWWLYLLLIVLTVFFLLAARVFTYKKEKESLSKKTQNFLLLALFVTPLLLLPYVINTLVFLNGNSRDFSELKGGVAISLGYLIIVMMLGLGIKIIHRYYKMEKGWFIKLTRVAAVSAALAFTVVLLALLFAYKEVMVRNGFFGWQGTQFISQKIVSHFWEFLPSIIVLIGSLILHCYFKHLQFSEENSEVSGKFGSAAWADKKDLEKLGAYKETSDPIIGMDEEGRLLRLPLMNKVTISPPAGGKTTSSSIPVLLTHAGPVLVFDVKGELWATTARYRAEVLGRDVITIDPYGVTKGEDFMRGKPPSLFIKQYLLRHIYVIFQLIFIRISSGRFFVPNEEKI